MISSLKTVSIQQMIKTLEASGLALDEALLVPPAIHVISLLGRQRQMVARESWKGFNGADTFLTSEAASRFETIPEMQEGPG